MAISLNTLIANKQNGIIFKLKKHIVTKGYIENLGQKELREFEQWLEKRTDNYQLKASAYTSLSNRILSL